MRSFKGYIDQLSTEEKVELLSLLYKDIADCGTDGDTELAHVNPEEAEWLKSFGGSGTRNPITGLPQFAGGSPPPPPAASTVTQQATIPDELKPYITDILEKSKGVQERREEEGYVPFEGPRIAEFSDEQEQAFSGVQGLVGSGQQYFDNSSNLATSGTQAPTADGIGQFMSPYMQNVVDIQKREALQDAALVGNQIGASAVQGAGGFGGSRQAILEAEHGRNTLQNLSDIQGRGQQAAYGDALNLFNAQRGRELAGSQQFANLGSQAPGQAMREYAALEGVGAQRQGQSQQALNIAQDEYEIARTFPERTLQDYNAIVRGYSSPLPASTYNRAQTQNPGTSGMQNLSTIAGLGLTGATMAKTFGGFKDGGSIGRGIVALASGGVPRGSNGYPMSEEERRELLSRSRRESQYEFNRGIQSPEDEPDTDEEADNYLKQLLKEYPAAQEEKTVFSPASIAASKVEPRQAAVTPAAPTPVKTTAGIGGLTPAVRKFRTPARDKYTAMAHKQYEEETGIMGKQKDRADDQLGNLAKFFLDFGAADPTEGNIRGAAKAGRAAADRLDLKGDKSAALELAMAGQKTKGSALEAANEKEDRTIALAYAKIKAGNRLDVSDAVALVGKLQNMKYSPNSMMSKLLMFQQMAKGDPYAEAIFEEEIQRQEALNDGKPDPNNRNVGVTPRKVLAKKIS